jgi:uncharacterized protein
MKLSVFQCTQCDAALFPARYFCPACGGAQWRECAVARGTVTESTVVRHRVGAQEGSDVYLASVATSAGPVVIARLDQRVQAGEDVALDMDDANRILARPIRATE